MNADKDGGDDNRDLAEEKDKGPHRIDCGNAKSVRSLIKSKLIK